MKPFTLCATLLLLLGGCSREQPPSSNAELVISGPFEIVSQDPAEAGYIFTRMQVLETLVDVDPDGELQPGLASSWQHSADFRDWRFTIRPAVSFHNQTPLTSAAVANSLTIASHNPGPLSQIAISAIEADTTAADAVVHIRLEHPYRPLAAVLANYSTAILAPASYRADDQHVEQVIGTGPYQVDQLTMPHRLLTRRFDNYWGQQPAIASADYITGHRSETRALMLQNGQADIVYNLDPASVAMLQQQQHVRVSSVAIPRTIVIKLNNGHPLLQQLPMRQALSLALDREGIAAGILRVPEAAANQLFGPSLGQWFNPSIAAAERNLQQANQLLDQLGLDWPGASRWRLYQGQPLTLEMITYANRPELISIATAIQAQWADIGVQLNVLVDNSSAVPAGHRNGTLQTALIARNLASVPDIFALLLNDFRTPDGSGWGPMGWSSSALSGLLTQMENTTDPAQLRQLAQQASSLLAQQLPLIPVSWYQQRTGVSKQLQGFRFDPWERSFGIADMSIVKP
ncbi:ABC transporter substrate-binding protein [Oceanobacter mangrovi]|uniref:ABC transporter substrate-binding protein n=1 Tax=Oceanobacter mangrovi TaxID=2862510 RepID=UPI001C8E06EC|nr:ABC transporter substrate-binding protein [Oceanobacter mangrovi]